MGEFQTTIQDEGAILRGSGKIEIAAVSATPSWTDAGAIQGLKLEEKLEVSAEENDNTDSEDRVTSQEVTVSGTFMEPLRDAILTLIRGGLDTRTATAGTLVSDHTQTVASGAWAYNTFIEIEHQNYDGTVLQIDATGHANVSGGTDGSLTNVTDFDMVKNSNGKWGIIVKDSTTVTTTSQALTITFDYTPAANVKRQSGDKSEITKFMARITTLNDGNTAYWIFYYGNIRKGFEFSYKKDDDTDRRVGTPFEFIFKPLPTGEGATANEGLVYELVTTDGF